MEQLLDEQVGAADHRAEARPGAGSRRRRAGLAALGAALEDQRVEGLLRLHLAAAAQRPANVDHVGEQEDDPDRDPQRRGRAPGERPSEPKKTRKKSRSRSRVGMWALSGCPARVCRGRGRRTARRGPSPASRAGTGRRRSLRSRRRRPFAPIRATIAIRVSASPCRLRRGGCRRPPPRASSRWPIHSTALVKSSAPARITAKLATRTRRPSGQAI